MKRSVLAAIAAMFLAASATAFAQPLLVQDKNYEQFEKINAEDNFVLRLIKADNYAVTLRTDERIAAHVQAYVKNGTLYLILDEKGYSRELKKQLKQKGSSAPVLEADVYMPTFNSLVVKNKVVIASCDPFETDTFVLTASDNALVSNVDITCTTGEINISRNAHVTGSMSVASKLYMNMANSAQASITQNGGNTLISQANLSYVDFKASLNMLELESSGGSESHISGTSSLLKVTGAGLTRIDAQLLESKEGEIAMSGSAKCHVNVTDHLKVNIVGGSLLTFNRNPAFEIERVVNSTLVRADDIRKR